MSYNILTIPPFDRQLKRLAKKYKSLKQDYADFLDELEKSPDISTPFGKNCFKIRLAISSKGKGKSGGARVVANVRVVKGAIYLLSIYDKSEKDNITDKELAYLLDQITDI